MSSLQDHEQLPRPVWSVVIPLYNKEAFIQETIRSVLRQVGDHDFEVLVVDDGSRDAGPDRVRELGDARVRLIQQSNAGVSAARNRGIAEARGEWVAFLDADDLWHPQALEALSRLHEVYPEAEVLGGGYVRVASQAVEAYEFAPHSPAPQLNRVLNLPAAFLTRGMPFFTSSVAMKRTLLQSLGTCFPTGESMGEDLDLWLRAAERGSLAVTSNVTALYRTELANSLMGSYRDLVLLPVWKRLKKRAVSGALPSAVCASSLRLVAEMEVTLSRRLAKAGRRSEAWQHLWAARAAARGHRWWVTFAALASGSRRLVQRLR